MTFVLVDSDKIGLSLAVYLVDGYNGSGGIAGNVSLKEYGAKPFRNLSGHYLFVGLPKGVYTVRAEGIDGFFDAEAGVDPAADNAPSIPLMPSPSYPFPASATLIRGMVRDHDEAGIPGMDVSVKGTGFVTGTTDRGEFVVFFKDPGQVASVGGKKLVRIGGDDPVIKLSRPGYGAPITRKVEVEEGKTVSLSITYP